MAFFKSINTILLLFFLSIGFIQVQAVGSPTDLKCEHLTNPIGIDNPHPRLTWRLNDNRKNAKQTAFRIIVGTDSAQVIKDEGNIWDTEKRSSDSSFELYDGAKLVPFTKYYWKVIVWDKNKKRQSSSVVSFETGMMNSKNRKGLWISDHNDLDEKNAPYFRKEFSLKKQIKSARAYIAVAGLYEFFLNGEKIGNHRLDPMFTRFDKRNLYVTYNITDYLQNGKNAAGVLLGNGWYNHQTKAVWDFDKAPWRNRPAFSMDIRIEYVDGSTEIIPTDLSWKTSYGGLIFNSIYTGEHFDANFEQKGWNSPTFDDSKWRKVVLRKPPSENIVSQQLQPIRNVSTFEAKSFNKIDSKTYVYDFGQNMAGVTKIKLSGEKGTTVKIKHGERLYPTGKVDISNIDVYYRGNIDEEPFQTDIIILNGVGEIEFMPKFNYKGFRYVEVTADRAINLERNSLTAYFMHSDVAPVGEIKASNPIVEKIWKAANAAYLSNLMGYPTDCPQREKNGWTGDGHFAIEAGLYNFDGITIYEKWMADHRDEQREDGVLPDIIPTGGWGYGTANGLDWTSTIAIIPWNIYLFYGDSKILLDNYENIKRYVNYVESISPNGLTSFGRGDWVPVKSQSNLELTSSVYYFVDAQILANAAKLFNKQSDFEKYSKLAEKIKKAINDKFLNRETGIYASGTQTELSVPLQWKVVPEDMISKVASNLAQKVIETNYHLDVGVLGAKAILNALSENGFPEIAYKVAVQDTYPSWGWWIVNGATTLLENWDLNATRDISDNHMMFGEIGAWFYKGVGGIFPDEKSPGFKRIILRPHIVDNLDHFEAKHLSSFGTIVSKWEKSKNKIIYHATIPANTTATLYLPGNDKKTIKLKAGNYTFKIKK